MVDFKNMMRKAQELQGKMANLQAEVATRTVEAAVGGGMVKAVVNGAQEVVSITIDPQVVKDGDQEMLEDLVVAAINEGIKKSKQLVAAELTKLAGGLPIPPGML